MVVRTTKSRGEGGGGGLHFRNPVDVFADATARATAFGSGGSLEGEHTQFASDRSLAIVIGTLANPTNFQTYTGGSGAYDDTAWLNRTDAVQGRPGAAGRDGAAGGGAWSSLGEYAHTASDHAANEFVATGIILPANRSVFGYRLASAQGDLDDNAGIMAVSRGVLDGKDRAAAGDTSASASRIRLPEFGGGGLVSGSIHGGLTTARELLISTSNANQDFAIEIFDYVPSAAQGGRTDAEIQALINATNLSALQGAVIDAQIPASIMRDAEFTKAAIENLIGLTAAQLNDLFTDATISGRTIMYTQADGTTEQITLPADMDTQDGVVASGAVNAAGTELTLTLDTGTDVVIDLPAVLRGAGLTQGDVDARIAALVKEFARAGERGVRVGDMDSESAADGQVATADGASAVAWEDSGVAPVGDHTRRTAVSQDTTLSGAEVTAGESSTSEFVETPTWMDGTFEYIFVGVPENEADITDIKSGGLSVFSSYEKYVDNMNNPIIVEGHKWWRTTDSQDGEFGSAQTLEIVQ